MLRQDHGPADGEKRHEGLKDILIATGAALLIATAASAQERVAVITPYLAQPGTQFYIDGFEAAAEGSGWEVNVIDTAGDIAAVISRIEDAVTQGVDAIVINVDPAQVEAGLAMAQEAGIPVVGMDAGMSPYLATNVTSNGYAMAAETAAYVVNRLNGQGNVVMFVFDPFPPVQIRGVIADAIFANMPDIEVLARVTPDVQDGGIADSRAQMEALLAANPEPGSAFRRSGPHGTSRRSARCRRSRMRAAADEGIVIVGMDANPQARDAIAAGGNFEASMAQDFEGIGAAAADAVARLVAGETITAPVTYVPTRLITTANVDGVISAVAWAIRGSRMKRLPL
jgi:ribose transport system substrate-binding protein